MLKVILIDDEPKSITANKAIIEMISTDVEVIGTYTSPVEGLDVIKNTSFDLLLLDIEMPELTGLELLKKVENINFEVIFITAYRQYSIDALRLSALDYILKPVSPSKLAEALLEAQKRIAERQKIKEQLTILDQLLEEKEDQMKSQEKRIILPSQQDIFIIQVKEIIRLEGAKNYTYFFLNNGKKRVTSKNIGYYEDSFARFNFMKIHRSHIINLYQVSRYIRDGYVEMINGDKISCSNALKDELLSRLAAL